MSSNAKAYMNVRSDSAQKSFEMPLRPQRQMADDDNETSYAPETKKLKSNGKSATATGEKKENENEKPKKLVNIFAKKHRKNLQRFLAYSFQNKQLLFWGNVGLLITSATQISLPYLTGRMVDIIADNKPSSDLNQDNGLLVISKVALMFAGAGVISSIFSFVRGYSFNLLGERVMLSLRNELFTSFLSKDVEFYDRNKSGELMSRITSDTAVIQSAASDSISILLRNLIQFIGSFVILWIISYELTLILFVIVPPLVIGIALFIVRFKKYSKLYQDKLAAGNSFANEAFGNIRVVKSFAREKRESQNFYAHMKEAYAFGKHKSFLHGLFLGVVTTLGEGALLCVIWYGGTMVLDQKITTGELSSFILYTITLSAGLLSIGGISNQIITAVGVSEKLFEMMDVHVAVTSGVKTKHELEGNILFENVTFEYPTKANVEVLKNISFEVKRGQVVALVGSSGSGKSSTVSLLERFYDVKNGRVLVDGHDIREYNLDWLREQIGFVSQEPTLFSGSLRDNITYGVSSFSQKDIDDSLEMANAKDFVYDTSVFPEGLETVVGERGVKLSGGQKQRIAIARALIKNPRVLIFDEATSALDAESEFQVQKAIDNLTQHASKTIILIAHRLSTIRNADSIIVFQAGEVKEIGTHKELLAIQNGFYAKLIARQINSNDQSSPQEEQELEINSKKQPQISQHKSFPVDLFD